MQNEYKRTNPVSGCNCHLQYRFNRSLSASCCLGVGVCAPACVRACVRERDSQVCLGFSNPSDTLTAGLK